MCLDSRLKKRWKYTKLIGMTKVDAHDDCRKEYTREINLKKAENEIQTSKQ